MSYFPKPSRPGKRPASLDWDVSTRAEKIPRRVGTRTLLQGRNIPKSCHQNFDSIVVALTDQLRRLHIRDPVGLHSLPDKILLQILEHLAPLRPVIQSETSLENRCTPRWHEFFADRRNLHAAALVNKRFYQLAKPLLCRTVFISQPRSLSKLFLQLVATPAERALIRHFICAVPLKDDQTRAETESLWKDVVFADTYRAVRRKADQPTQHMLLWFHLVGYSQRTSLPSFASVILASLLCVVPRLQSLDVHLGEPPLGAGNRSVHTLWRWFLDDIDPWIENDVTLPKTTHSGELSKEQLAVSPCWPPPFLRDVTVEFALSNDKLRSGFVHLDVVPHADAIQHTELIRSELVRGTALKFNKAADLLKPSNIQQLDGLDHISLLSYLDGLKRIPDIEYGGTELGDYIEALKSMVYSSTPPEINRQAAKELTKAVNLLPIHWSKRLSTRSKKIHLPLSLFLEGRRFERIMTMDNVTSLTLYADGDSEVTEPIYELENRLLGLGALWQHLEELSLPLRMNQEMNAVAFPGYDGLHGLKALLRLNKLSITWEALFGPPEMLTKMFGGPRCSLDPPYDRDANERTFIVEAADLCNYVVECADDHGESLNRVVEDLPPELEELRLIDWYGQYTEPDLRLPVIIDTKAMILDGEDEVVKIPSWTCRLADIQAAVVHGLRKLAPVLKSRRPSVKRLVFHVHHWNDKEAYAVWTEWGRNPRGLRALRREFSAVGIALKVLIKGDHVGKPVAKPTDTSVD